MIDVNLHLRKPDVRIDDELGDCHLHGQRQGAGGQRR